MAFIAFDKIAARTANYQIMTQSAVNLIISTAAVNLIVSGICIDRIITIQTVDVIVPNIAKDNIIAVLFDNADKGRALVKQIASKLAERSKTCGAGCQTALDNAIITAPDARDTKITAKLDAIAGRVLSR